MASKPPYWVVPTTTTPNYANLSKMDGLKGSLTEAYEYLDTFPIDGVQKAIRSFYSDGKYYIYWTDENNYLRNTVVCVDLQSQGMPLSTLSMKIIDAHVSDDEQAYVMINNSVPTTDNVANYQNYLDKQVSFSNTFVYTNDDGDAVYKFNYSSNGVIPLFIRTGAQSLGYPTERKHFRAVEFHGEGINNGLLGVRVWIDGRYVCEGRATMSDNGNCIRKVNLPVAKSVGYSIDIEFTGMARIRGMEIKYEAMA